MKTLNLFLASLILFCLSFTASAVEVVDMGVFIRYDFTKQDDGFSLIITKDPADPELNLIINEPKQPLLCMLNYVEIYIPAVSGASFTEFPKGNISGLKCENADYDLNSTVYEPSFVNKINNTMSVSIFSSDSDSRFKITAHYVAYRV